MAKKEEKVYTGTEIIGIAQMHKSNAVPIRSKKSAEEVAKMRRGWPSLKKNATVGTVGTWQKITHIIVLIGIIFQ